MNFPSRETTTPDFLIPPKGVGSDFGEVDIDVPPSQKGGFYYFIIALYFISLVFSLIVNILFLILFIRGRKIFAKRAFIILVIQFVIAGLLTVLSNLVCSVPVVLFMNGETTKKYIGSGFYMFFNTLDSLSSTLIILISFILALHRLLIFIMPKDYNTLTLEVVYLAIFLCWIPSIIFTIFKTFQECYFKSVLLYNGNDYDYVYYCGKDSLKGPISKLTTTVFWLDIGSSVFFPLISLLFYVIIFVKLLAMKKDTGAINYGEREMLKQAVVIFMVCQIGIFYALYVYKGNIDKSMMYLSKRIGSTITLLSGALAPLFVILTSKDFRNLLPTRKKETQRQMTLQSPATMTATASARNVTMRHSSH